MTLITAYFATAVTFFAIDIVWLGFIAKRLYFSGLSHLLADKVSYPAAAGFYALYVVGLIIFAVAPALETSTWSTATVNGALFGFFCYATYDMTNQATLKGWPVRVTIFDIAWGTTLSAVSATVGYYLTQIIW